MHRIYYISDMLLCDGYTSMPYSRQTATLYSVLKLHRHTVQLSFLAVTVSRSVHKTEGRYPYLHSCNILVSKILYTIKHVSVQKDGADNGV